MRIGVIGDTHRHMQSLERAVEHFVGCEMILHTGDNFADANIIHSKMGIGIIAVKGNCDFEDVEDEILFESCGKRIFLCHGHKYGVKHGSVDLEKRAREVRADIVVFGHTHIPRVEEIGGILFINPGSTSRPRSGNGSAGVLSITDENVEFELFEV